MIHHFQTLASTNDEASSERYAEGDVVVTESQSRGRGQRGHGWESRAGENLTLSLVLEPEFLPPTKQFLLSECVALGVRDMLEGYGIEAKVKWTNDIYVGKSKITGILIEHKLQGPCLARTIVGIGLNVNQVEFSRDLPNPISMAQVAGREFDRSEVLERLLSCVMARYEQLRRGEEEALQADYRQNLFRLEEWHSYAWPDGSRFRGRILGVEPTGALRLECEDGEVRSLLFKEVEFVISGGE